MGFEWFGFLYRIMSFTVQKDQFYNKSESCQEFKYKSDLNNVTDID